MAYLGNPVKINAILKAVGKVDTLIDIGCNYGFTARAFLESNLVKKCYGLELKKKTVNPVLLKNPAFTFYEADLTKFVFPQIYEVGIYTAVYHRVLEIYGKETALKVWEKVISACNKTIIFETGLIGEKGKEKFITELPKYYSSNEEYMGEIFSAIGDRLVSIEEVIKIPVRGVVRTVYKINLLELI